MSAYDLFFPQLLAVTASSLKQTIFVSPVQLSPPGNFDNVDCFCFTKPLIVNAVLVCLLLLMPCLQFNQTEMTGVGVGLFSINFALYLTR